jgi:hypothetical protein
VALSQSTQGHDYAGFFSSQHVQFAFDNDDDSYSYVAEIRPELSTAIKQKRDVNRAGWLTATQTTNGDAEHVLKHCSPFVLLCRFAIALTTLFGKRFQYSASLRGTVTDRRTFSNLSVFFILPIGHLPHGNPLKNLPLRPTFRAFPVTNFFVVVLLPN